MNRQIPPIKVTISSVSPGYHPLMFHYCRDLVRRVDYEGFLIISSLSGRNPQKLDSLLGVKAFDAEIAMIAHSVKTSEAASVRYNFWKVGLDRIKNKQSVEGHPVLESLAASDLNPMQISWLEESLDSRAQSLDRTIVTLADLDEYGEKSLVPILFCLEAIVKSPSAGECSTEALKHLGQAQIVVRRLRGLSAAIRAKSRSCEQFIPLNLLGEAGLNSFKLLKLLEDQSPEVSGLMSEIVSQIAAHAQNHLASCLQFRDPFMALSTFTAARYLNHLQSNNFSILNDKTQYIGTLRDGWLPLRLYLQKLLK